MTVERIHEAGNKTKYIKRSKVQYETTEIKVIHVPH